MNLRRGQKKRKSGEDGDKIVWRGMARKSQGSGFPTLTFQEITGFPIMVSTTNTLWNHQFFSFPLALEKSPFLFPLKQDLTLKGSRFSGASRYCGYPLTVNLWLPRIPDIPLCLASHCYNVQLLKQSLHLQNNYATSRRRSVRLSGVPLVLYRWTYHEFFIFFLEIGPYVK